MSETKLTPTDEQCGIIDAVATGGNSIMAEAYAGTAKTTTIQLAAPGIKVPALALAFNRTIAKELTGRLPANFQTKTFNGLGYGAWMRANPQISNWALDDRKLGKLVSQEAKDRKIDLSADQWDGLRQLVTQAMQAGLVPNNQGRPLTPDTPDSWQDLAEGLYLGDDSPWIIEMAKGILQKSIDLAKHGTLTFDDQIYCSACLGGKFPLFPVMFVDEAQDLSPLNHHMLAQSLRDGGRLVVVGDSRQAIYAFRGADSASMAKLRGLKPKWADHRLTLTFRCPKEIVARQQGHAPGFRAWHTNPEGRFHRFRTPEDDGQSQDWEGWGWKDLTVQAQETGKAQPKMAILCRNNAPLMAMAFKLIRQGIGVAMLGTDLGKGLTALSRKIIESDEAPADICRGLITDWITQESSKLFASGDEAKVAGVRDRGECLLAVLDNTGVRDAGEMRQTIKRLFSQDVGQVTLGTAHRSKGLEWDLVVHLDPWRVPSKWAREAAKAGDTTQLTQEYNLLYVLETRTKHTLINANLEDFQ